MSHNYSCLFKVSVTLNVQLFIFIEGNLLSSTFEIYVRSLSFLVYTKYFLLFIVERVGGEKID